jgi:hypothetical protein
MMKHLVAVGLGILAAAILVIAGCPTNVPVTGVTLNVTDNWDDLSSSPYQQQLVATVHPSNATNTKVTWASSDPNFTVSSDGLVTGPSASGLTNPNLVVTVTTDDGHFTATCSGSASCPMLYVGDGTGKFNYLTDLQGPIIGMPGNASIKSRTPDYVVLEGLKSDASGTLQVKVREIQAEVAYIDEAKLVPVDVPDGYEIASASATHASSKAGVDPRQFYSLKSPRLLRSAIDQDGRDVTAQLKSTDGVPAPVDKDAQPFYTLDFGLFSPAHARLVVEAWALYSSGFSKHGNVRPSVSVRDDAGKWAEVTTFRGPHGDEKTMVFDLSGLFPSKDRQVRLNLGSRPGLRWVVDSVRLDDSAPSEPVVGPEVQPSTADLSQGGLATFILPDFHNRGSVLDDRLPFNGVGLGHGKFTRYGDVGVLLTGTDDKFVIMGMGDQLLMSFRSPSEPPAGYHRIWVLKVLQYYKVPYVSSAVAQLPFQGMSAYPYPATEHFPNDHEHLAYLATWNTRENR